MSGTNLSEPQLTALLEKFVEKTSFRAKVDGLYDLTSGQVLSSVSGDLLARALGLLRQVRLLREFSSDQVSSVLSEVWERNSSREIVFQCELAAVSSELLARAVLKMETIQFLRKARLLADQAKAVFDRLRASSSLRRLALTTTGQSDLSSVEPAVLSQVLVKLDCVRLSRSLLTPEQLQVYFLKMAESEDSNLKYLDITEVDLSSIPHQELEVHGYT